MLRYSVGGAGARDAWGVACHCAYDTVQQLLRDSLTGLEGQRSVQVLVWRWLPVATVRLEWGAPALEGAYVSSGQWVGSARLLVEGLGTEGLWAGEGYKMRSKTLVLEGASCQSWGGLGVFGGRGSGTAPEF